MQNNILNLTIEQLFKARLYLGQKHKLTNKNMIFYILGVRHNISILNLEKLLYNLRIVFSAIIEITAQRGIFFLIGGFNNILIENILNKFFDKYKLFKYNFNINGLTTGQWVNGMFSNWQIIYNRIQVLKPLNFKNTLTNSSLINLKNIKFLDNKIIPDIVFMFNYNPDAVKEISNLNIPIIGVLGSDNDPNKLLYTLIGNSENLESIHFFCQLIEEGISLGQLEEQEKFLYYFMTKVKQTIIK